MDYVLGVDGGGTKTVAQIADLSGKMVAESESRSSNYKSVGIEVAKEIEFLLLEFLKKYFPGRWYFEAESIRPIPVQNYMVTIFNLL